MYKIIIYIFLTTFIISCNTNNIESPETEDKEIDLEFFFTVASTYNVQTRSYEDNFVRCIDVLVFNQNKKFIERIKINDITGNGSIKNFKVRLQESSNSRTLHFIANGRDIYENDIINFDILTEDKLEAEIIPELQTQALTTGNTPSLPLPMWGQVEFNSITYTTEGGTIKLLRNVAALTVERDEANNNNGLNDFTLTAITVLDASDRGKIAPDNYTISAQTPSFVSSIPENTNLIDYIDGNGDKTWVESINNKTPNIYLYEKQCVSSLQNSPLSIIIKGEFKGSEYFYKICLATSDENILDVIRNHRYTIKIKKVDATGYTTFSEAYNSDYSSNIYVEILDEEDDIVDMVADGKYELGVSATEATIYGSNNKNIIKVINTNPSKIPDLKTTASWLTGLSLSPIENDLYYLTGNFQATSQERETEVTIKIENLEKTIRVIQKPGEGTIGISIDTLYLSPTRSSIFIELKVENNASWQLESNYTNVAQVSPMNGTGNTKIEFKAGTRFTNSIYSFKNRDTGETIPIYVGNLNLNIPDTIWVESAPGTANLPPEMIVAQGGIEDWTLGEVYCIPDLYTPSNWVTDAEKIDLNGNGKYRLQLKYALGAATDKRKAYLPISHVNDKSYIKRVVIMQEQTTVDLEGDYLFFELDYANVTCEITGSASLTYVRPFLMFEMINGDIPTILSDNKLYTLNQKPLGYGSGNTLSNEIEGQAHFTRSIRKDAENREIFYWSGADAPDVKYEGFYINVPNLLANFSATDDIDIIFDFYGLWGINRTEDPILIKIKGYNDGNLIRTVIKEITTGPSFYTFHNDGGYLTFQGIYRKRLLKNGNPDLSSTFRDSYTKIAQITFNTKTKKTKVNFVIDE